MCKTIAWYAAVSLVMVQSTTGFAQVPPPPPTPGERGAGPNLIWQEVQVRVGTGAADVAQGPGLFDFEMLSAPVGLGEQTVTHAPYSAEGVTEVVQMLADGNRIERRNTIQVARDSAGRTRREQGVAVIGSLVGGANVTQISVFDPVERVSLIIDPSSRTVRKLRMPALAERVGEKAGTPSSDVVFDLPVPAPAAEQAGATGALAYEPSVMGFTRRIERPGQSRVESLGTQVIEGVSVEGTRTTVTIPAGALGNEREIAVVTERWFSPELRTLVLSRHADPRMGETTYRLTNIIRTEPASSLFEVPPDYTVVEGPAQHRVIIRRDERP